MEELLPDKKVYLFVRRRGTVVKTCLCICLYVFHDHWAVLFSSQQGLSVLWSDVKQCQATNLYMLMVHLGISFLAWKQ